MRFELEICISNELEAIVRPLHPRAKERREEGEKEGPEERRRKGRERTRERVVTRIRRRSKAIRLHAPHPQSLTSSLFGLAAAHGRSIRRVCLLLRTRYSIPLSVIQSIDKDERSVREGKRSRGKERKRISRSLDAH